MPRACNHSRQDAYAANLSLSNALGTAVLNPVPLRPKSGRVGDIAFFNRDGSFEWIRNAFHSEVYPTTVDDLRLRRL